MQEPASCHRSLTVAVRTTRARIIRLKRPGKPKEPPKDKEALKEAAPALTAPQALAEEYFIKASALDVDESRLARRVDGCHARVLVTYRASHGE